MARSEGQKTALVTGVSKGIGATIENYKGGYRDQAAFSKNPDEW